MIEHININVGDRRPYNVTDQAQRCMQLSGSITFHRQANSQSYESPTELSPPLPKPDPSLSLI